MYEITILNKIVTNDPLFSWTFIRHTENVDYQILELRRDVHLGRASGMLGATCYLAPLCVVLSRKVDCDIG